MLADSFVDGLGECQQAHALEDLARGVAGPDVLGMLPEPFVESTFDALAQRPGTRMLFEAASRVCAPSLVPRMQELAAARAAEGDRTSTLVSQVGELTFEEFFRIDSEGDEDGCVVRLSRPRQKRSQLLLFSRDRRLPHLPLRVGSLTEPLSPRQIDGIFAGMRDERDVPVPAAVDEFPAWFVDGARASAELRLGPTAEGGELAVQLLRQLGEPELADRLARLFPLELDYDEDGGELEEAQHESLLDEADEVAGDFARWLAENASGLGEEEISLARLDVGLALEFRANYLGAGVEGVWTDEELDAFLLSYVPAQGDDERGRPRADARLARVDVPLPRRTRGRDPAGSREARAAGGRAVRDVRTTGRRSHAEGTVGCVDRCDGRSGRRLHGRGCGAGVDRGVQRASDRGARRDSPPVAAGFNEPGSDPRFVGLTPGCHVWHRVATFSKHV